MLEPAVAIDFGTSRTKAGWRDSHGEIHLLSWADHQFLPSTFWLPSKTDETIVGDEAEEAYILDPDYIVEQLKQSFLNDETELLIGSKTYQPQKLLNMMFRLIAKRILAISEFESQLGEVITTIPACSTTTLETAIKLACHEAGFPNNRTILEPDAAAIGWLGNSDESAVLILDCGGGTTDWTLLEKTPQGDLRRPKDTRLKPNSIPIGGAYVDEKLCLHIIKSGTPLPPNLNLNTLQNSLRQYKESIFLGHSPRKPRVQGGVRMPVDKQLVNSIYNTTLVEPVMSAFLPYLEDVSKVHPDLPLILVGGAVAPPLLDALKLVHLNTHHLKNAATTVIIGALMVPYKSVKDNAQRFSDNSFHERERVRVFK